MQFRARSQLLVASFLAGIFATGAAAQPTVAERVFKPAPIGAAATTFYSPKIEDKKSRRAPWEAPLASLLVPGSGQALLGQQRALGYVVAESFLIIRAQRMRNQAVASRTEYRRLAAEVARAGFGTDKPVGPWDYYETLESTVYPSSGAYDLKVGGKFTPETDESTYNGSRWLQARETYWDNPNVAPAENSEAYQQAISFYQSRAFADSFRWSWLDHQLEQTLYVQTIKEANDGNRAMVTAVGFIAANHLVSMIDAYVNVRLRRYGGAGLGNVSLRTDLKPDIGPIPTGARASITASITMPKW